MLNSFQEQKTLDKEINSLRDNLKVKTSNLSKLEGGPDASKISCLLMLILEGQPFFLKPTKASDLLVNNGKSTETITDIED